MLLDSSTRHAHDNWAHDRVPHDNVAAVFTQHECRSQPKGVLLVYDRHRERVELVLFAMDAELLGAARVEHGDGVAHVRESCAAWTRACCAPNGLTRRVVML